MVQINFEYFVLPEKMQTISEKKIYEGFLSAFLRY